MFNIKSFNAKQFRGQGFMTISKYNSTGDLLFIADKDSKMITLISTTNNKIIGTYTGHVGVIWNLDITPDSKYMISCSGDMSFIIWEVSTGKIINQIQEKGIPKYVSIHNNLVAISCDPISKRSKGYITIYNLDKLINNSSITPNNIMEEDIGIKVTTVNWLDDENLLISSDNGNIKKINYFTGEKLAEKNFHNDSIKSINFNMNKHNFVTGSLDSTSKIINTSTFDVIHTLKSDSPINCAIFTADNNFVMLGGGTEAMMVAKTSNNDLRTKIFKVCDGKLIKHITNHFGPIRYIDFNPNNSSFVTASQDGTVKIHYFHEIKSTESPESESKYELFGSIVNKNENECELANEVINIDDANNDSQTKNITQSNTNNKNKVKQTINNQVNDESIIYKITSKKTYEPKPVTSIKVTNLPSDIELKELWDRFEFFGRIEERGIKIKNYNDDSIAFINYCDPECAQKAINAMHKKTMGYCVISVELAQNKY